jgi:hypothetical protein
MSGEYNRRSDWRGDSVGHRTRLVAWEKKKNVLAVSRIEPRFLDPWPAGQPM